MGKENRLRVRICLDGVSQEEFDDITKYLTSDENRISENVDEGYRIFGFLDKDWSVKTRLEAVNYSGVEICVIYENKDFKIKNDDINRAFDGLCRVIKKDGYLVRDVPKIEGEKEE